MAEEFGPWIKHKGGRGPRQNGHIVIKHGGEGIGAPEDKLWSTHPCWFWSMKRVRVGWFRHELRPVCTDPRFAPIVEYCYRKPPAASLSAAEMIEEFSKERGAVDG